jgi:hypothetical protein
MATFTGNATGDELTAFLELAADQHLPAVAVLPEVRTEQQLATQLLTLVDDRWRASRVPTPEGVETDDVFIGLEWRTSQGLISSPMGLAPLGTMPATRRAPYTCIAAWSGGRENKFRKKTDPVVHLLDTNLDRWPGGLAPDTYKTLRINSENLASQILEPFGDKASNYRSVAFRLSNSVSAMLAMLPAG